MTAEELWERVREANRAWTEGRPKEVAALFHRDAVMAGPDGRELVRGREAIVESFVDYCRRATTRAFQELDHEIRIFGDTAVLTYGFAVTYELEDQVHDERGREVLVFARGEEGWAVVWRMQLPDER
ncbi:MAG: SgcJ/EcaC family oxidoreductase [Gemmatimonadetes bacterium]|nr:nuclear transport factor 2 family protein [Gemmatimonadota bacterium]NIR80497.1 nuclear transport factor 2 family protein [Gemmatimonadota bacterium]NIT89258.1 nuclear transport factor 2 family protein [Gemmatimonadota bacterium]NIU33057.1 nuclear transport factor 2 family protein [Gemmatimonadota bacterium]NIU37438.1 SgcJ/EcaC family oxidoreductase [Gemmatimonadota bacterium]